MLTRPRCTGMRGDTARSGAVGPGATLAREKLSVTGRLGQASVHIIQELSAEQGHERITPQSAKVPAGPGDQTFGPTPHTALARKPRNTKLETNTWGPPDSRSVEWFHLSAWRQGW